MLSAVLLLALSAPPQAPAPPQGPPCREASPSPRTDDFPPRPAPPGPGWRWDAGAGRWWRWRSPCGVPDCPCGCHETGVCGCSAAPAAQAPALCPAAAPVLFLPPAAPAPAPLAPVTSWALPPAAPAAAPSPPALPAFMPARALRPSQAFPFTGAASCGPRG